MMEYVGNYNNIKVSVVVAVYNSAAYLCETLDSICAQTLKDIEIILVDDGSTDESYKILEEYAARDNRIKVLKQTEPSDGAALARNMGVSVASGEFVSVLDADDLFEPDMLQKAYDRAVVTGAEAVIFDGDLYDEKLSTFRDTGMILRREFLPGDDVFAPSDNADRLFFMTIGSAWNVLFKRELIVREDLKFHSFHHADDLGFVYLGFATAGKIAVLPDKLVHYRCNNSLSQAANLEKWPEAAAGAMTELKKELDARDIFDTYRVTFTELAFHYFELYLDRMPDYDGFEKLYLSWKDRYMDELGLLQISDDEFVQKRIAKIRQRLLQLSPGQYLFEREHGCGLFAPGDKWRTIIPEGGRIILYCAGKRGRELFGELINDDKYRIVSWADAKFESYGYPVEDPQEAVKREYDHILVAIESEAVFASIKKALADMGVDESKIIRSEG